MYRLFPLPLFAFLKIARENGGFSIQRTKNVMSWLIKTVLLEPLRWMELATQLKKVRQHTIRQDPVFILGFYRSGTSYLQQFMSQDDRFGYHTNFQMVFPDMMLCSERWLSPFLNFICRIFKIHDPVHRVQLSFSFPGEEDGAMTTAVDPRGAGWGYFFPQKMMEYFRKYVLFDDVPEAEIEAWARSYLFLLKKISLAGNNKPLLLKSPPHTARIRLLLSLFPNARFILIHRHPLQVYASNKRFLKVTHSFYAVGSTRSVDLNSVILDTYAQTMQRYLLEKELIPVGNLVELPYEDFVQAPVARIKAVYKKLRLPDFSYCEAKMTAFAARQKKFVRLEHELPEKEKRRAVSQLAPFLKHWGYSPY